MPRWGDVRAVTVPGCVSAWVTLSKRYGKLPFADLPDTAQICDCNGVCKGDLVAAVTEGGWSRTDPDGRQMWPRTDPAVIVLVHDGVAGPDGRHRAPESLGELQPPRLAHGLRRRQVEVVLRQILRVQVVADPVCPRLHARGRGAF